MAKYGSNMKMVGRIPAALAEAMADKMYMANFSTKEEMDQFYTDILAPKN